MQAAPAGRLDFWMVLDLLVRRWLWLLVGTALCGLAAFLAVARRAGMEEPSGRVEHVPFALEAGHAAGARLLGRGVTGMICASDPLALGAIRAARRLGLRVPEDVSVVGYDDSALMMCTDPPLTTIRQPIEAMGRAAVKLLSSQIDGTAASAERLLFEPELVVRGSTAPPPGRGPWPRP